MSISLSNNNPRIHYTATNNQTVFAIPFEFFDNSEIVVFSGISEENQLSDYNVSGGDGSTGNITFVSGRNLNEKITIIRRIGIERTTNFVAGQAINRAALNTELDTLTAIAADNKDRVSRSIKVMDGESAESYQLEIPQVANRLGRVLAFHTDDGRMIAGPKITDVDTVARINIDIANLADIEDGTTATDAISGLAAIKANVTTAAGIASNITTVAGNTSNINTVASANSNVSTVAGSISNVNAVGASISDVNTVADFLDTGSITVADKIIHEGDTDTFIEFETDRINFELGGTSFLNLIEGGTDYIQCNKTLFLNTGVNLSFEGATANGFETFLIATDPTADRNIYLPDAGGTLLLADGDGSSLTGVISSNLNITDVSTSSSDPHYIIGVTSTGTGNKSVEMDAGIYFTPTSNRLTCAQISLYGSPTSSGYIMFEGATEDAFETFLFATDPTSDNAIYLPNASGTLLLADGDGSSLTGVLGDVVDDTTPQLGSDLASNGNDIVFADNDKAIFGTGSDLQIYHDGSNSYIDDQGTGRVYIRASDQLRLQASDGENYALFAANGAAQFYYDNSLKLATTSTGVDITGTATATQFTATSDLAKKENLEVVDSALNKVQTLTGYTYNMKEDGSRKAGLIAQDVEKILPEAVSGEEGNKALDYSATIALLVNAIKEQQEQINYLRKELDV